MLILAPPINHETIKWLLERDSHSNGRMLLLVTCMIIESVEETIHEWNDLMDARNGILRHLLGYEQENLPNNISSLINIKKVIAHQAKAIIPEVKTIHHPGL